MAITAAPFALKNLGLDAEPLRQAVASIIPNAGGLVQTGDLAVTQTTVLSLGVLVGIGRAWMPGNNTSNLAGQSYSTQAQYFALNDAPVTVNLATADPTNPRIDLIYIGAVDTFYGGASNQIKLDKITGTPAGSPSAPTLPAGSNAIALATVAVAANATTVSNANITNVASQYSRLRVLPGPNNQVLASGGVQPTITDFANDVKVPIIQVDTYVVSTDASGYFSINYPAAFPGGVLCVMFSNGDSAQGRDLIISTAGSPFAQTASIGYGSVVDHTGAIKANATIRVNMVAYGW